MTGAERFQQPESVYYSRNGDTEKLCFYDKNQEQRSHREPIPAAFRAANVLRYEQRYLENTAKLLNVEQVTGAMLSDDKFFTSLLDRWQNTYRDITKINNYSLSFEYMKASKQFQYAGLLALIEKEGGPAEFLKQIDIARRRGVIDKVQAFRRRQEVKEAIKYAESIQTPNAP